MSEQASVIDAGIKQNPVPADLPAGLLCDFDLYNPHQRTGDYFQSWRTLQEKIPGSMAWTSANGGHWIAMRGPAGAILARAELRITLQEWLKRIPVFSLAPDAEIEVEAGHVVTLTALPLVW